MRRVGWGQRRPRPLAGLGVAAILVVLLAPGATGNTALGSSGGHGAAHRTALIPATPNARRSAYGLGWHNLTGASPQAPGVLGGMVLVPDPDTGGLLLFGGSGPGGSSNATWLLNGSNWIPWAGSGPSPSPRSGAQGAWDPSEDGVLVYGGIEPDGNPSLNDTWLFRDNAWTNLTPTVVGNPGPRGGGSLAVDPTTGAAVLYGGVIASATFTTTTWTFEDGTWTNITASAGTPPPGRVFSAMTADATLGGVVLYGGQDYGTANDNDTWLFRNGTWHELAPRINPGTLRGAFLADDSTYGAAILFGGDTSGSGTPTNETWALNGAGNWTDLTAEVGLPPSARWTGAIADDPWLGGVVLFGGCQAIGCAVATNQTWFLEIPPLAVTLTSPDPSPASGVPVQFVAQVAGGVPPVRYTFAPGDGAVVAADSGTANYTYAACGTFEASVSVSDSVGVRGGSNRLLIDVGSMHAASWCSLTGPGAPAARGAPAAAYDPSLAAEVVFGGSLPDDAAAGDTWLRTDSGWAPAEDAGPGPSARADSSSWYDPTEGGVVVFGGQTALGTLVNDTWLFTGTWSNITAQVGAAPSPRFQPAVAYDSTAHEAVLFGGLDAGGSPLNDTWVFTGGRWSNVTASAGAAPSARDWASAADDPSDGGIVLFGGQFCSGDLLCGDTWTFNGSGWHTAAVVGPTPSPRRGVQFAYNAEYGADLLFGGAVSSPGPNGTVGANDAWTLVGSTWTNVTTYFGTAPPGRWAAAMDYDPALGGLLLFGGCTALDCASAVNDTWSLAIPSLVVTLQESISATSAPANASLGATAAGGLGTLTFSWTFGDGTSDNRTSTSELQHEYRANGNFSGALTVTDVAGVTEVDSWTVNLTANNTTHPHGTTPLPKPHVMAEGTPAWYGWAELGVVVAAAAAIVAVGVGKWRSRKGPPTTLGNASPAPSAPPAGVAAAPPELAPGPPSFPPEAAAVPGSLDAGAGSGMASGAGASEGGDRFGAGGSLGDRILIHLHRQGRLGPQELASLSVTQAGLSDALGRPQSAFARTLQRLESTGLVFTELRHVKGASRRLKVYRLTPVGEQRAAEIRSRSGPGSESP